MLHHGTTLHGAQAIDEKYATEPLTYYNKTGPLGQVFSAFDYINDDWNIGLVGLGTGTTACYAKPNQNWTYYEIDPLVVEIAKNEKYFTYLKEKDPNPNIILGDARIFLNDAEDEHFDLMILNAFSSGTVPSIIRFSQIFYPPHPIFWVVI